MPIAFANKPSTLQILSCTKLGPIRFTMFCKKNCTQGNSFTSLFTLTFHLSIFRTAIEKSPFGKTWRLKLMFWPKLLNQLSDCSQILRMGTVQNTRDQSKSVKGLFCNCNTKGEKIQIWKFRSGPSINNQSLEFQRNQVNGFWIWQSVHLLYTNNQ